LVLAFVAMPFDCEGNRRLKQAQQGLEQLKSAADGVICLPNQEIFKLIDEKTSVVETFKILNGLLTEGVSGVWRLMARKGLLEIHYADLCALLRERRGESSFATAEAVGATRSREVMDKLFAHPMLDGGKTLSESDAVLVSLTGGPDLTMAEVHRVMEHINGKCERAQVMMGAAINEDFRDKLAITLIAVRRGELHVERGEAEEQEQSSASEARSGEDLNKHLLNQENGTRPNSRFVPPAPELAPEKVEQLVARQTRSRKNSSKMRQGQLPLEIVSKGRFDKSEPTIHKGEDLDVPTYIRRGVALN
jgi:cell division protein FtsZ